MNILKTKKGSVTVEAAIFLPIIIIVIISIAYIMKVFQVQVYTQNHLDNETKRIALEMYVLEKTKGIISEEIEGDYSYVNDIVSFLGIDKKIGAKIISKRVKDKIRDQEKNRYRILGDLRIVNTQYDWKDVLTTDICEPKVVDVTMTYQIALPFSLKAFDNITIGQRSIARAWTGSSKEAEPLGFETMKDDEKTKVVYIFKKTGKKYHKQGCQTMVVKGNEVTISQDILDNHDQCNLCLANEDNIGQIGFIFESERKIHTGTCTVLTKNYQPMSHKKAIKEGYTPCKHCNP